MSATGTKRTFQSRSRMSAFGVRADIVKYTPHRRSLRRRGEVRPLLHLHAGDQLVATVLGPED